MAMDTVEKTNPFQVADSGTEVQADGVFSPDDVDDYTADLLRREGAEIILQTINERHGANLQIKGKDPNTIFGNQLHGSVPGALLHLGPQVSAELERIRVRKDAQAIYAAENAPKVDYPQITNLAEFLAQPDDPVTYAVDQLLTDNGRAVFVAKAKSGKTTTVGNLIRALADGTKFLDRFDVQPAQRILLLDDELSEGMLRRWLRTQNMAHPERVEVVPLRGRLSSFNILDETVREHWAQLLGPADWIIFDGMAPALSVLGLDEHKEATKFLNSFDELTQAAGIRNTVIIHHAGHSADRARGDSGIMAWPDALWTLTKDSGDDDGDDSGNAPRYLEAHGRDVDLPKTMLEFDPETKKLTAIPGTKKDQKKRVLLAEILTYLAGITESSSPPTKTAIEKQFAADRRFSRNMVREVIDRAVAEHLLVLERGKSNSHLLRITSFGRQFASSPQFASSTNAAGTSSSPVRHTPIGVASCELHPDQENSEEEKQGKEPVPSTSSSRPPTVYPNNAYCPGCNGLFGPAATECPDCNSPLIPAGKEIIK